MNLLKKSIISPNLSCTNEKWGLYRSLKKKDQDQFKLTNQDLDSYTLIRANIDDPMETNEK